MNQEREHCNCCQSKRQTHNHEFEGNVKIAEANECPHNHRFAGTTSEVIPLSNGNHYHKITTNTDFYEDHHHAIFDKTGPAIWVGDSRHVHFVKGKTTINDEHEHEFLFATLIDNPIGEYDVQSTSTLQKDEIVPAIDDQNCNSTLDMRDLF